MSFSLIYLIQRFFYRIFEFIRHWYVDGFIWMIHKTLDILERMDRVLALRITARNLFRPLYQDYTVLGYFLGFVFRSGRALIASLIYLSILVLAAAIYLAWAIAPIYVLIFFSQQ